MLAEPHFACQGYAGDDFPQSFSVLPIICLEGRIVIRKPDQQEAILDDGQWLWPLLSSAAARVRSQPEARTVARIRRTVLNRIEREAVSLVA